MAKRPKPKVITKEQFARWSPSHQARALADKRIRQRIETAALPKEYQERRKASQWRRTPITEGSATTYGDLMRQRAYLEPLTFGEGDRQLATRTQNLAGLQQASNDWFSQYRQQVADANTAASQAAQATVQGGRDMIQGITNQSNMDRDVVARQLRDRAAQLGQASTAPEFEQLANAARDTRAAQLASSNQAMNAGAAAASQEAASRVVSAGLADQANRESNQRRVAALDTDKRDYATKKDAWRAKFIEDAISEARKQVLEDRAYKDKAQLERDKLAVQQTNSRSQARNSRTTARSQRETARHNRAMENKSSGRGNGSDGRSSDRTRRNKRTEAFNSAVTDISGISVRKLIRESQRGARDGKRYSGGADALIRTVMAESKLSRELAKRVVYAVIAYNGRVPSSVTWKNAPKTWEQAIKMYQRGRR